MKRRTFGFLLMMLGLGIIIYANYTYNPCFCPTLASCPCDTVEQANLHAVGLTGGFILMASGLVVSLLSKSAKNPNRINVDTEAKADA